MNPLLKCCKTDPSIGLQCSAPTVCKADNGACGEQKESDSLLAVNFSRSYVDRHP